MPRKSPIPKYGTCTIKGKTYYRTRIKDADGKRFPLYGHTREELYNKVQEAKARIGKLAFNSECPTLEEYCNKWLMIQKARLRTTTYIGYESKVNNYIIQPLGHMYMIDVLPDDIKMALLPIMTKSESVYRATLMLYKEIFDSAVENRIIAESPCSSLSLKGGKPAKEKEALSDDQVEKLLSAIKGLPPYVFVMIGLFCGLRREEILGLKWDCVFLDAKPYLSVRRAWHTENNRPVILDELKTKASYRKVPIPAHLAACLKEAKATSKSDFVISNKDGQPLSYTQFQRMWNYIKTRTVGESTYTRYVDGEKIKHTVTKVLGEKASHNSNVVYSLDFHVTPHQLRHTYITNLLYAGVDLKTVQYLAGHKNSKMTTDVYAKVKYKDPVALYDVIDNALDGMFTIK